MPGLAVIIHKHGVREGCRAWKWEWCAGRGRSQGMGTEAWGGTGEVR